MIKFVNTEAILSIQEIEKIENFCGLIFPDEYKNHLLKYNGGQCEPNLFMFNENGRNTESFIDWFLAIYDGEYNNLREYIEIFKIDDKRIPSHFLPIAHDPGGNLICISCAGNDFGKIYFWDHENELDYSESDDKDYSNIYLIADTFDTFINELR